MKILEACYLLCWHVSYKKEIILNISKMSGCLIFLLSALTVSGVSIIGCKKWEIWIAFSWSFYFNTEIACTCSHSNYLRQWQSSFLERKVYREHSSYFGKTPGQRSSLKAISRGLHHRHMFPGQRHRTINLNVFEKNIYVLGKATPWRKLVNSDSAFVWCKLVN